MFNQRRNEYYDSRGREMAVMSGFKNKIQSIFGSNGTHQHLNPDVKLESLLEKNKASYSNTKMVRDLKTYTRLSLTFDWIKPYSCR